MRKEEARGFERYLLCIVTTLVAFALSMAIPHVRQKEPFALFFAAVAVTARYGGRGPGFLACILAAFLTDYIVIEPAFTWSLGPENLVPVLAGFVVAAVVSQVTANLKKANDRQREYEESLRSMATEMSFAEERERRRIATGLHDRLGQNLALTKMKLEGLRDELKDAHATEEIDRIGALLKQLINEVRSFTFELSPPILYEFGLGPALEWLANSMHERYGLVCTCQKNDNVNGPNQDQDIFLFQAVRELLTNVVKHARASKASVTLTRENRVVRVKVEDDGVGFNALTLAGAPAPRNCFGLFNIRERIEFLGGSFSMETKPEHGTRVILEMPLHNGHSNSPR